MSMAVGIPIGFGAGIAVGIASGRQSVRENLRDYVHREQVTILDRSGQAIPVEAFLDLALRQALAGNKRWAIIALVATVGILVLGLAALGLLLWLT